jgi:hypothetical protein
LAGGSEPIKDARFDLNGTGLPDAQQDGVGIAQQAEGVIGGGWEGDLGGAGVGRRVAEAVVAEEDGEDMGR